jgi:hypothetical protein
VGLYADQILPRVITWPCAAVSSRPRAPVPRPGGAFRFVEHGLAPGPGVARLQQLLTPLQRRAFGGCHLDLRIGQLVAAAGLELARLDTYYMKGPRPLGHTFEGVAIDPDASAFSRLPARAPSVRSSHVSDR